MSTTELAKLSGLSKAYISVVKHGKRPPSQKLLNCLQELQQKKQGPQKDYYRLFMQSRQVMECSEGTMQFYQAKLSKFFAQVNPDKATERDIEKLLLHFSSPGNRHAHFRAIKAFYNWRERTYGMNSPMTNMKAPKLGKLIMPALEREPSSFSVI